MGRQGKLTFARSDENSLNLDGYFWWLSGWKQNPTHKVAGMFELCQQLFLTRLCACQKTHTHMTGEVMCRLSIKAPGSACGPLPLA